MAKNFVGCHGALGRPPLSGNVNPVPLKNQGNTREFHNQFGNPEMAYSLENVNSTTVFSSSVTFVSDNLNYITFVSDNLNYEQCSLIKIIYDAFLSIFTYFVMLAMDSSY